MALIDPRDFAGYFLDVETLTIGETAMRHDDPRLGPGWLCFRRPVAVVQAHRPEDVRGCLERASAHADAGGTSVGFLTYEAGSALRPEIASQAPHWPVLAWFALYYEPPQRYRELLPVYDEVPVEDLPQSWSEDDYRSAFQKVKQALADGETYQVNLTFRQRFRLRDSTARFFARRCGIDPPKYAAFLHGGDWQVASFSPELLFERRDDLITTRPMKGTALVPRAKAEIPAVSRWLSTDPKSIAENVMIVDMVRNDLGVVSDVGTVETPRLLEVERHRGLLQMTSTVTGRTTSPTPELLAALFPAASITGAPKAATSRIIRDLEGSPRHLYCGSIGVMTPGWQRFNVAIRTALVRGGEGEFGVGSGVVWDSDVDAEYQECLDKRELLLGAGTQWELVEAIGAHDLGDSARVGEHLARLARSAQLLNIPVDEDEIRERLSQLPPAPPADRLKVRIALRRDGTCSVSTVPSLVKGQTIRAVLASRPVPSGDPNLRLKTNSRSVLDEHLEEHPHADEVLLYNERGELTEFCRGNLVVEIDGQRFTPHPESGCLPGVSVARLVRDKRATWAVITPFQINSDASLYISNSVVGLRRIDLHLRGKPDTGEQTKR